MLLSVVLLNVVVLSVVVLIVVVLSVMLLSGVALSVEMSNTVVAVLWLVALLLPMEILCCSRVSLR